MKSKRFEWGAAAAFMLFVVGAPLWAQTPAAQAKQLAASLNAIKAKSAAAKGAVVKLAGGFVWLQSDLAVPAGVTLDVTAKGATLGLGDVTLTVDGTIIAGPNHVRLEDRAGAVVINGNGTIRLQGKGHLFYIEGNKNAANRKLTLDGVTLNGLKDNDRALVGVGKGGEFVLKSGAVTGNTVYKKEGWADSGGVGVWGGILTMEGGEISGNSAKSDGHEDNGGSGGGGVSVWETGVFTMKGGAITGNSAGSNGGGVLAGRGSTFTMEGGVISANTCRDGGGVAVASTFTMKGGEISGNTAEGDGGGARVFNNGTFTMEGGVISGNTAKWGGGVHVKESTFTLAGGRIQGGTDSDGFAANTDSGTSGAMNVYKCWPKWGAGGAYTKGGVPQRGGSNIFAEDWDGTDDTLIAAPRR
jgi:hypothetical protein